MFVWAAWLPVQLASAAELRLEGEAGQTPPQAVPAETESSIDILPALAAAADAARVQGEVHVEVGGKGFLQRFRMETLASGPVPVLPVSAAVGSSTAEALSRLCMQRIYPPCSTLPFSTVAEAACITFKVHLSSQEDQRVRVVVVAAATGAVLVDEEHEVVTPQGATGERLSALLVQVPVADLVAPSPKAAIEGAGGSILCDPAALRLIITTPAAPHSSTQPCPPARVLATATHLVAPVLLASELCGLHAIMEEEGVRAGMSGAAVWSHRWQPLMNDISLCIDLLSSSQTASATSNSSTATGAGAGVQYPAQAFDLVTDTLREYFSRAGMEGWFQQLQSMRESMPEHHKQGEATPQWGGVEPQGSGSRQRAIIHTPSEPSTPTQEHPLVKAGWSYSGQFNTGSGNHTSRVANYWG
jgi:hypothetical protein